jgi:hypothetical protein
MPDSLNALTPPLSRSTGRGGKLGSAIHILSWAIFLGASWTWCIGMYLPVILIRDYGVWAFVVFAVPNVVGAAAMAWVLPNAEASRKLVANHRLACECFSIVTVAFHIFFYLAWICYFYEADYFSYPGFLGIVFAIAIVIGLFRRGDRLAAFLVMAVSFVAIAKLWTAGAISFAPPNYPSKSIGDLSDLAVVCLFGFLLCPYLDLTFHQARQATTPAEGRAAFGIGFGVFFFAMILFTLSYTPLIISPFGRLFEFPVAVATALGVHLVVQSSLKVVLHLRAIPSSLIVLAFCVILPAAFLGGRCYTDSGFWPSFYNPSKSVGELIYRLFMSFYGLVFPAYVWICIFRRGHWKTWAISVLIAAPMYWMGFIERQTIWLVPGVAVVLLAGLYRPKIAVETAQ